jgi:hypothetical protein
MANEAAKPDDVLERLLPLDPAMSSDDMLRNLRMNALLAHQRSVGRGDELVRILQRTIEQMEKSHSRVQNMSIALFVAGLILLAVGMYEIVFGSQGQEIWAALLGGTGGVAALAATFWTAPLDKISDSISDLVKLEAAFLGYIRVIGELDSAFQMQYLDILAGSGKVGLDQVINDTTKQMKDIMTHTLDLIDKYVEGQGYALSELKEQTIKIDKRLEELEAAKSSLSNSGST